jgi:hypothetical protein
MYSQTITVKIQWRRDGLHLSDLWRGYPCGYDEYYLAVTLVHVGVGIAHVAVDDVVATVAVAVGAKMRMIVTKEMVLVTLLLLMMLT